MIRRINSGRFLILKKKETDVVESKHLFAGVCRSDVMNKLGLGVLGLGEGRSIISAGIRSERWNVAHLCDINEQLGKERCREFKLDCFTTSVDGLLANEAVDVVGVYTPDHLHAEHIIKSLQAGKH